MPLKRYGVLKGKAIAAKREEDQSSPHYQVHIQAGSTQYRIAVNVKSQLSPSELLFLVNDDFQHPITANLPSLEDEFTLLSSKPGGQAVDFIRGNLFDRSDMRLLPPNLPGPDNDLSDQIEHYVKRAMQETDARVYAFGERWGPEGGKEDKIFSFRPGNGVHDIHMNQGNVPRFAGDDGVWQDGALMFHFPSSTQWVAVFLAFQSQAWHTDDKTGHAIVDGPESDHLVRIVGALVNPIGPSPEQETVTLLNVSPTDIDLAGWKIADRLKNKMPLSGTIHSGEAITVKLSQEVQLGNKGGIITLLNDKGLKVDGVSYTGQQAHKEGWTIIF
ncbi:MAG TPA: DUF2278 family protein [Nitrospira sp.]|nr:DUF2278 family protein [Nitrospira sp.]